MSSPRRVIATSFINNTRIRESEFPIYIDSKKKIAAKAAETKATVLISNHSEFDAAVDRNRMLAGRGNGPHPYEVAPKASEFFQLTQGSRARRRLRWKNQQRRGIPILPSAKIIDNRPPVFNAG